MTDDARFDVHYGRRGEGGVVIAAVETGGRRMATSFPFGVRFAAATADDALAAAREWAGGLNRRKGHQ